MEVIPFISPLGLTMTPALSADQRIPNLVNAQAESTKTGHTVITKPTVSQQTHGNKKYAHQILIFQNLRSFYISEIYQQTGNTM